MSDLMERAEGACELCRSNANLLGVSVDHDGALDLSKRVLTCDACRLGIESTEPLDSAHWYCLQESIWSGEPAVAVLAYRLLHRVEGQVWATNLLGEVYLEDDVRAWAERGLSTVAVPATEVFDSNGSKLVDGDAVTLTRDLDVKGAGFTAKRGTLVKNIRLGDDPTHIEGRVNKVSIMLKTCFLKKAT